VTPKDSSIYLLLGFVSQDTKRFFNQTFEGGIPAKMWADLCFFWRHSALLCDLRHTFRHEWVKGHTSDYFIS